jgi:SAM-dependent methyltransferase
MNTRSKQSPSIDWSATADWYDRNAEAFRAGAAKGQTSALCTSFLEGLDPGARVLDAGCGTGRDAAFIAGLGFTVSGFDPSTAMLDATRQTVPGIELRQIGFEEFDDTAGSWDAIWAMASMLHVPRSRFAHCLAKLERSLTPQGRLFVCVKHGSGEGFDDRGRPMSYHTLDEFRALRPAAHVFAITTADSAGVQTLWSNMIINRQSPSSEGTHP